jgi:hypothetical protein
LRPCWKPGTRWARSLSALVEVSATSFAFNTKQVSKLKVGDEIALAKGKVAPVGC